MASAVAATGRGKRAKRAEPMSTGFPRRASAEAVIGAPVERRRSRSSSTARWSTNERASVLVLMPAAALVFVVLGAIGFDFAAVFLAEREVADLAAAAANDAAGVAVDHDRIYADGTVALDPARARAVGSAAVADARLEHLSALTVTVTVAAGAPIVTVDVTATVVRPFAGALPGGPDETRVQASAAATATED